MIPLLTTRDNGVKYTLASFTPKHKVGRDGVLHFGIFDNAGCLYAWTMLPPALEMWREMFPRALAQQEAA